MKIKPGEITDILKREIKEYGREIDVAETGSVLSVGDGIARVYGLDEVQAGEMVEFEDGTRGMALNLENDNVGVVLFGDDRHIEEGGTVKPDLNKRRLHSGQYPTNLAQIDVANQAAARFALNVQFLYDPLL